jgi:hypothetical protein
MNIPPEAFCLFYHLLLLLAIKIAPFGACRKEITLDLLSNHYNESRVTS